MGSDELCMEIEAGKLGPKAEAKERARTLREKFDWDENSARKIWCWGPETEGANVVVDSTQAVQYLIEIKEHVTGAFQWATKEGPLCEENMRGIRFNIMDVHLHRDSNHRGAGQIMPPTRRACFAAELTAKPTLQEPVFLVEITCPQEAMSGVYNCMNLRRGCVFEENPREGTPLVQVKAHLPVSESFGFVAALRQATSGQAFPLRVRSLGELAGRRPSGGQQDAGAGLGRAQAQEHQGGDAEVGRVPRQALSSCFLFFCDSQCLVFVCSALDSTGALSPSVSCTAAHRIVTISAPTLLCCTGLEVPIYIDTD